MSLLGGPSARREVFKAKHRKTGKKVALKKVLMENEKEGVSTGWVEGPPAASGTGLGFRPAAFRTVMLKLNVCVVVRELPYFREFDFQIKYFNLNILKHLRTSFLGKYGWDQEGELKLALDS